MQKSDLKLNNLRRYLDLRMVLTLHVQLMAPYSWVEKQAFRLWMSAVRTWSTMMPDPNYDPCTVDHNDVIHYLTEIYHTHKSLLKARLANDLHDRVIPSVSASFDLCKSKVSKDNYFGKRWHSMFVMRRSGED